jgi:hypothetical protein
MMDIVNIHQAFRRLVAGDLDSGDDCQIALLRILNAHPDGLTGPELVERMLGRKLTGEEDSLVFLLWEEEGRA